MNNSRYSFDGFLGLAELQNLSEYEQYLYQKCFEFEQYKLELGRGIELENKKQEIESVLPSNNWGLIVFKPPRASTRLRTKLQKELFTLLKQKNFFCLDSYEVNALTKDHIRVMYPGDTIMPYWHDLEQKLLNLPAIYFLIVSPEQKDIRSDIEMIRGWYKVDKIRGRLTPREGLRAIFRQLVEEMEGCFEESVLGSEKYEDSGIHAPCSLISRFLQLLGFMAIDVGGRKWARLYLPWLTTT